ncbi:helix-hairpin-helix domain-containing protein [Candidatus Roizmanbacteria bacterium]|nr:helix-hairpin-helix domain-containing protein [Candidatus Roizmanbacteria bacterium]
MDGFIDSFKPLLSRYKIEALLIITAGLISLLSFGIYIKSSQLINERPTNLEIDLDKPKKLEIKKIIVDLSGAVEKPDVYEVSSGARLKDILILAGGLSLEADRIFFSKNFNLAKTLSDQDKIYIPTYEEVEVGNIKQNIQTFQNEQQTLGASTGIKINNASLESLDGLPGVGKVTAQKIIQNRPYGSVDELLTKKVVGKSVFEKIKDLIQL